MKKVLLATLALGVSISMPITSKAATYTEVGQYGRPFVEIVTDSEEQIEEEIKLGEMELISQLVQAEAGNQSLDGKRLVVDVVLNRVADPRFPDTVEEVIFADKQFSVILDGAWDKAAWNMSDEAFEAVKLEYEKQTNTDVLYFCATGYIPKTKPLFKEGGHYFSK